MEFEEEVSNIPIQGKRMVLDLQRKEGKGRWKRRLADKETGKSGEDNKGLVWTDLCVKRQRDEG